MWTVSLMGLELSNAQLYIASGASLVLALYALTLPKIPVAEKKQTPRLPVSLGWMPSSYLKPSDGDLLSVCDDAGRGTANNQRIW
jgi:hypothetical protein